MYVTESSRWRAVQCRDESAASAFIYAVTTTKIFCRPSCPSRLARRANICFYDSVEDAVRAGYRPCRRCKPDQPLASHLDNKVSRQKVVDEACRYMEQANDRVKFSDVAKHVHLSTRYLHGLFKEVMGITPAKYVELYRTCQALDSESSASPVSIETAGNHGNNSAFQDAGCLMPEYAAGLDFGMYDSGLFSAGALGYVRSDTCLYNVLSTASTEGTNSKFVPNEFDLYFNEPLPDTKDGELADRV